VIALPHSYAGVAPEWLTAVLSTSYPDVQVTSVNIVDEIYGAAAKARLELTYAGPDYGLPATMTAKTGFVEPKATTFLTPGEKIQSEEHNAVVGERHAVAAVDLESLPALGIS
jgi:hypothetical protein